MITLAIPLLHVSDPISAERFYCDQLGFKKTFAYRPFGESGPCYFGMVRDNVRVHLSSFPGDGKAGNAIVLIVDNVDDLHKEFILKGVEMELEPTDQSWGNREMYITDGETTVFVLHNGAILSPNAFRNTTGLPTLNLTVVNTIIT